MIPAKPVRDGYRFQRPAQYDDLEVVRGTRVQRVIDSHIHCKYEIALVDSGQAQMTVRGTSLELVHGSVAVVNPREAHDVCTVDHGCTFKLLYVAPERMQRAARAAGLGDAPPFFAPRPFHDPDVAGVLEQVHAALEQDAPRDEVEPLLEALLAALVLQAEPDGRSMPAIPARSQSAVERVRRFIEDHYPETITLDQLSEVAGLSKYHLIRVFGAAFGMPPHAYQNAVRVARAREALASGRTAADVAQATGFADQSHFTRRFKRMVGVAPGEYARGSLGRLGRIGGRAGIV